MPARPPTRRCCSSRGSPHLAAVDQAPGRLKTPPLQNTSPAPALCRRLFVASPVPLPHSGCTNLLAQQPPAAQTSLAAACCPYQLAHLLGPPPPPRWCVCHSSWGHPSNVKSVRQIHSRPSCCSPPLSGNAHACMAAAGIKLPRITMPRITLIAHTQTSACGRAPTDTAALSQWRSNCGRCVCGGCCWWAG
jgi:hypothetical protein